MNPRSKTKPQTAQKSPEPCTSRKRKNCSAKANLDDKPKTAVEKREKQKQKKEIEGGIEEYKDAEQIFSKRIPTETQIVFEEKLIEESANNYLKKKDKVLRKEFASLLKIKDSDKQLSDSNKNDDDDPDDSAKDLDDFFKPEKEEYKPFCCEMVEEEDVKIIKVKAPSVPKMTFYEPIHRNKPSNDILQLPNIPYISEETDDLAISSELNKLYPDGIHGNIENITEVSDEMLFYIMKQLLKDVIVRGANPDAFYYALYCCYPNKHSQRGMSEVFPSLCKRYAPGVDLTIFEPWKLNIPKKMVPKFISRGNYFSVNLPISTGVPNPKCSSSSCFNDKSSNRLIGLTKEDLKIGSVKVYARKNADLKISAHKDLLHSLFSMNDDEIDFCELAKKYIKENTSFTCKSLYEAILSVIEPLSSDIPEKEEPEKDWRERQHVYRFIMGKLCVRLERERAGDLKKEAEKEGMDVDEFREKLGSPLGTSSKHTPCAHFGPCGIDVKHCSCKTFCSPKCKCDINCPHRFPGCRCSPGQCRTKNCICAAQEWECTPDMCPRCLKNEDDEDVHERDKCHNYVMTRGKYGMIKVKASEIAGYGAFLTKDAGPNEFLGEYVGQVISEAETERRANLLLYKTSYIFALPCNMGSIDSTYAGNEFRFVNHSSNPNCEIIFRMINGEGHFGFKTKEALAAGSEITFDYSYDNYYEDLLFMKKPEDRAPKLEAPDESEDDDTGNENIILLKNSVQSSLSWIEARKRAISHEEDSDEESSAFSDSLTSEMIEELKEFQAKNPVVYENMENDEETVKNKTTHTAKTITNTEKMKKKTKKTSEKESNRRRNRSYKLVVLGSDSDDDNDDNEIFYRVGPTSPRNKRTRLARSCKDTRFDYLE